MDERTGNPTETDQYYYSYMMRLLRTQNGQTQVWRVSLEEPLTEQVHRFNDLADLFAFLLARTGHDRQTGVSLGASTGSEITGHHGGNSGH